MNNNPALVRIHSEITNTPLVLFMEGTPMFPLDGSSAAITQYFALLGLHFASFNLLDEPDLREGLAYLNGQDTFPHLFILGKFYAAGKSLREKIQAGALKHELINSGLLHA